MQAAYGQVPQCAFHEQRPADAGACSRCGTFLCTTCRSPSTSRVLCDACFTKGAAALNDGWMLGAKLSLWFCGVCYLLIGAGCVALVAFLPMEGPEAAVNLLTFLFMAGFSVVVAVANFAAAVGLSRGAKWAFIATLVLAALYVTSICFPFGGVMLYALLRRDVRERFGFNF
jgi:hypothetical protein